jgi:hypothetical protein
MEKIAKRIAHRHLATTKNKASVEQTNGARITADDVERIIGRKRAIWKGTCRFRPTLTSEQTSEVRFSMMSAEWTRLIGVVRIYWASDSSAAVPWAEVAILSEQVPVPVPGDAKEKGYIPV